MARNEISSFIKGEYPPSLRFSAESMLAKAEDVVVLQDVFFLFPNKKMELW